MNSGRVAIRNAKGLLRFGNEKRISSTLYADALALVPIIRNSDTLMSLLGDPSLSYNQKNDILTKTFTGKVHPCFLEFFSMIILKGRTEYTLNSLLLFCDLYRKENNILNVTIESADILTSQELNEIETFINNSYHKNVELNLVHKPQLIAGYVLIVDGKMLDYSVSGQLIQYKKLLGLTFSK